MWHPLRLVEDYAMAGRARDMRQLPVHVLNHSQHNFRKRSTQEDLDEIEDWTDRAARRMYEGAGLGPNDVDRFNPYDGYAPMAQFFLEGFQWHGVKRGDAFAFYAGDIRVEGPHPFWSSGDNLGNGRPLLVANAISGCLRLSGARARPANRQETGKCRLGETTVAKHITRTKVVSKDENGNETTSESEIEKASLWDRATSIATISGIIIALITAWVGISEYFHRLDQDKFTRQMAEDTRSLEQKTKARESKKTFFDKQSELYFKSVATVASITNKNPPLQKDLEDFENMFWGSMAMVEDDDVDQAMVLFRDARNNNGDKNCLRAASLFLAHCVKKSLETSWDVKLGAPPEIPCTPETRKSVENTYGLKYESAGQKSSTR
jgi:hypothetical protein